MKLMRALALEGRMGWKDEAEGEIKSEKREEK